VLSLRAGPLFQHGWASLEDFFCVCSLLCLLLAASYDLGRNMLLFARCRSLKVGLYRQNMRAVYCYIWDCIISVGVFLTTISAGPSTMCSTLSLSATHSVVLHIWLMQEKVEVNGPSTHPVWKYLKSACPTCDGEVTWNFKVSGWGQVTESCVASQYVLLPRYQITSRRGDRCRTSRLRTQQSH
jgi:hypothetical protein